MQSLLIGKGMSSSPTDLYGVGRSRALEISESETEAQNTHSEVDKRMRKTSGLWVLCSI